MSFEDFLQLIADEIRAACQQNGIQEDTTLFVLVTRKFNMRAIHAFIESGAGVLGRDQGLVLFRRIVSEYVRELASINLISSAQWSDANLERVRQNLIARRGGTIFPC